MLKTFIRLSCLLLLLAALPLQAQNDDKNSRVVEEMEIPTVPHAAIAFDEEVFDFGMVEEGTLITHVYTFTNTSNEALLITNARGSCGCTVPSMPTAPIAPGETASITVQFNTNNKRGMRNQKVTITANTSPAQTFIYLTGEVYEKEETDLEVSADLLTPAEPVLSPDCFIIYPNPTAEFLRLEVEEAGIGESAEVSIYDYNGQLMAHRRVESVTEKIEFTVSHYPAGNYIANVQIGDRRPETRCFVVAR